MTGSVQNLYDSNMRAVTDTIRNFSLFGESAHLPDVMHCETIAARSALHDWELAPHRHTRLHQVLLVESGGGQAHLEGGVVALRPMSLLNVAAGDVHGFAFQPGTQGYVATLADELLDELLAGVGDVRRPLSHSFRVTATAPVARVMRQVWREFQGRSPARALVLRGLCATLLGLTARAASVARPAGPEAAESRLQQRFDELVEAHYLDHWRVSDYAQALGVTPTHLSRVVRAVTGGPASRQIDERLMREARRHLAYTRMGVKTIAYALGFVDPAYFTRAFTRTVGVSPRAFRDRLSGDTAGAADQGAATEPV